MTAAVRRIDIFAIREGDDVPARGQVAHLGGTYQIIGPEHALNGDMTFCGIPKNEVELLRHYWRSDSEMACQSCISAAKA